MDSQGRGKLPHTLALLAATQGPPHHAVRPEQLGSRSVNQSDCTNCTRHQGGIIGSPWDLKIITRIRDSEVRTGGPGNRIAYRQGKAGLSLARTTLLARRRLKEGVSAVEDANTDLLTASSDPESSLTAALDLLPLEGRPAGFCACQLTVGRDRKGCQMGDGYCSGLGR
jgi:hypothetical protein